MYAHPLRRLTRPPLALSRRRFIRTKSNATQNSNPELETRQSNPRIRDLNEGEPDPALLDDHRKPWFYTMRNIGNFVLIPIVTLYAVFVHDWGDRDHVFMPPRQWLERQRAAFFSLSDEERELANSDVAVKAAEADNRPESATGPEKQK